MTNQQFLEYIDYRIESLNKLKDTDDEPVNYAEQIKLLADAKKIMTYASGPERRRFRRDFEQRLGLKRRRSL